MLRHGFAVLCLFLVGILGMTTLAAQTGGAMLYANGTVRVNGQNAGDSTSVFSGDRVDVTASSAGSINRSGSSVVVSPDSSIQYNPDSIELLQGSARVSTSKGMSATVGQVVVSPENASAKFDVTKEGNKVVIVSREGALKVKDGSQIVTVQPGAKTELAFAASGTQALAAGQAPKSNVDFLTENRLAEHPFYGVTNGVASSPDRLPICADLLTCIRPNVSQIRPCCCPPRVMCN